MFRPGIKVGRRVLEISQMLFANLTLLKIELLIYPSKPIFSSLVVKE